MEQFLKVAIKEVSAIMNEKGYDAENASEYYLEELGSDFWPEYASTTQKTSLSPSLQRFQHINWLKNQIIGALFDK